MIQLLPVPANLIDLRTNSGLWFTSLLSPDLRLVSLLLAKESALMDRKACCLLDQKVKFGLV
jgi:hypothetical protein